MWGYDWSSVDGIFQGVSLAHFDRVLGQFRQEEVKSDHFGVTYIPDHLFKEDSCLPPPQEMAGEYDIIYYGGELSQFFGKHYRTARGTLKLSSIVDYDKGVTVTAGTVMMHPCMDQIDVIPFGGNYRFVETARIQRQGHGEDPHNEHYPGDTTLPTGVIKVNVTDPPDGVSYRGMLVEKDNKFTGEMRIFREKTGAGLVDQEPLGMWSDEYPSPKYEFASTQEAEEINRAHFKNTCSWLRMHTCLNELTAFKVGEFVSPPPVFFFEKGDIQIDIEWPHIASGSHHANSCIIARRRRPATVPSGPGLLLSNENKYEKEMRSVQADIGRLEQKKDVIWFAYKCSEMIRDRHRNDDATPRLTFPHRSERVKRCLVYMKTEFFNQQLSLYGLHLEQKQFVPVGEHSFYRLDFSRIP